jgi:hypothetical protein
MDARTDRRILQELDIVTYRSIARQRFGKHIPAGTKTSNNKTSIARQRRCKHASSTIEAVFFAWSVPRSYLEDNWRYKAVELKVHLWNVNQWAPEAEESPLLRFITRKCLVNTL